MLALPVAFSAGKLQRDANAERAATQLARWQQAARQPVKQGADSELASMASEGNASATAKAQGPLITERLCSVSGALATNHCEAAHTGYDVTLPSSQLPRQACTMHRAAPSPAMLAQDAAFLQSVRNTSVAVQAPSAAETTSPVAPSLVARSSGPALIMNGWPVLAAEPVAAPASGGAHPYFEASGANRIARLSDEWRTEEGIRVMRALPTDADPDSSRLWSRPGFGTRAAVIEQPVSQARVAFNRTNSDESDGDGERHGFFHRLFSGGR